MEKYLVISYCKINYLLIVQSKNCGFVLFFFELLEATLHGWAAASSNVQFSHYITKSKHTLMESWPWCWTVCISRKFNSNEFYVSFFNVPHQFGFGISSHCFPHLNDRLSHVSKITIIFDYNCNPAVQRLGFFFSLFE